MKARVAIHYCTQCRFVLRATWLSQELLMTFGDRLSEVAMVPSGGGVFDVYVGDELVASRERDGGFPESKALKQRDRDRIEPEMDLGHSEA